MSRLLSALILLLSSRTSAYVQHSVPFTKRAAFTVSYSNESEDSDTPVSRMAAPAKFNAVQFDIFNDEDPSANMETSNDAALYAKVNPVGSVYDDGKHSSMETETEKRRQAWIAAKEVP